LAKKQKIRQKPWAGRIPSDPCDPYAICLAAFSAGLRFGAGDPEFRSLRVGAFTHGGGRRSRPNKMKHIFYTNREEAAASAAAAGCIKIREHLPRSNDDAPAQLLWLLASKHHRNCGSGRSRTTGNNNCKIFKLIISI